jgi:hypothetical protein
MLAMFLILLIAVGNFALGFCLAVHFGLGPAGWKLPTVETVRMKLRAVLRLDQKPAAH